MAIISLLFFFIARTKHDIQDLWIAKAMGFSMEEQKKIYF